MANDINKYKNILQQYEDNQRPVWNKKHNWQTIESKISQKWPQKLAKRGVYLAFLLVGVVLGWILKPTASVEMNNSGHRIQDADTIFREVRVVDTLTVHDADTFWIAQNKVIQKYDTVYIAKEILVPQVLASTNETENKNPKMERVEDNNLSIELADTFTHDIDNRAHTATGDEVAKVESLQKYIRRTHKEYAPYVFIKDTVQSKSIDIEFDLFRRRQFFVNKYERH